MPTSPTLVHALVELTYTQAVLAAIIGPTSLPGGGQLDLSVQVNNGATPLTYQWFKDGVAIGGNSSSISTTLGPTVANYQFVVLVTDAEGDTGQDTAVVSVTPPTCLVPPCP